MNPPKLFPNEIKKSKYWPGFFVPMTMIPLLLWSSNYFGSWTFGPVITLLSILSVIIFLFVGPLNRGEKRNFIFVGYFYGITFGGHAAYFSEIFWRNGNLVEALIMAILFCAIHWTYYQVSVVQDPGIIPSPPLKDILHKVETQDIDIKNYCQSCVLLKPYRSKHCSSIDRCIEQYDHFCVWTSGAIGRGNHRIFMLFLISGVCTLFMYMFTAVRYLRSVGALSLGAFYKYPFLVWADLIQAFIFFCFVFGLFVQQNMNIMRGLTVNELINYQRYPYLLVDREGTLQLSMYDNGFVDNWLDFWKMKDTNPYKVIPSETTRDLAQAMGLTCPEELSLEGQEV